ncbi:MAG TPA: AMIN domain-containing protein, partial [Thermodesulfobacteriota bacterium]|nr:AMIN domain-containing protein [Thermodesulfobacteriota bacterium]
MSLMNYRDLIFKRVAKMLSVVLIVGGCASQPRQVTQPPEAPQGPETPQQPLALISNIAVEEKEEAVRVVIKGSAPLTYEVIQAESPLRLIIDVAGSRLAISGKPISVSKGVVSEIIPSEFEKEGKNFSRIEIAMSNTDHYEVLPMKNDLWIDFPKPSPAMKKAEKVFAVVIDDTNKDYVQVDVMADGVIENFTSFNLRKPTRLVVDLPGLTLLAVVKEKALASPLIKKLRWGKHADYLRLVLESSLNELPPFEILPTSHGATIFLGTGFEGRKSQLMSMTPSVANSSKSLASSPETKPKEAVSETKTEGPQKDEAEVAPAEKKTAQFTEAVLGEYQEQPIYTGTRISLDFKDADINNILRLIAEVSNLNIVAGDDVKGTVTIKLNDVPWDQALDTILLSNNLGKTLDGNILRIAPVAKLEKQRKEALAAKESQAKLEPLQKALIPINYAQAKQLKPVIQNSRVLSPRGSIEVDERTNTLIVIDIEKNIAEARTIIDNLDTPIPQVLIEAKIIQINPTYTKELGVTWSGDFKTTAGGGHLGVAGRDVTYTGGTVVNTGPVVDLAPSSIGTGTGGSIALGYIRDNFNIFNKIAAMEKDE